MAKQIASTNGFKPTEVQSFLTRIGNVQGEIRKVKASNAKRCQELNDDINEILDEARAAGIPKKELKAHLKVKEYADKIEAIRDDLEDDEQEVFDQLAIALGPLGEAARAVFNSDRE
jgi:uncharacterized protein (UPF0335 family)